MSRKNHAPYGCQFRSGRVAGTKPFQTSTDICYTPPLSKHSHLSGERVRKQMKKNIFYRQGISKEEQRLQVVTVRAKETQTKFEKTATKGKTSGTSTRCFQKQAQVPKPKTTSEESHLKDVITKHRMQFKEKLSVIRSHRRTNNKAFVLS